MTDADQSAPEPEELRQLAEQLRRLADQFPLPDIEADLLDLAGRFERMATEIEARLRLASSRNKDKT